MKLFIKFLLSTYVLIYAVCAFVHLDLAILAHTNENCRLGFIFAGAFLAIISFFVYASFNENE